MDIEKDIEETGGDASRRNEMLIRLTVSGALYVLAATAIQNRRRPWRRLRRGSLNSDWSAPENTETFNFLLIRLPRSLVIRSSETTYIYKCWNVAPSSYWSLSFIGMQKVQLLLARGSAWVGEMTFQCTFNRGWFFPNPVWGHRIYQLHWSRCHSPVSLVYQVLVVVVIESPTHHVESLYIEICLIQFRGCRLRTSR